jgi:hypothetical protein
MGLRSALGERLERWEMDRKVRKLNGHMNGAASPVPQPERNGEVAFSPDRCKGHFDQHGWRTLAAFSERLRAVETRFPEVAEGLETAREAVCPKGERA